MPAPPPAPTDADFIASPCPQCGGTGPVECAVLFDRLLALDHSRAEPWGPLHAVTVTCYRLQHPATCAVGQEEPMLDLLRTYRDGGLEALHRWTEAARRSNTHRRRAARS